MQGSESGSRVEAQDTITADSVDVDERKLADLGRRTIEMFTIAHIFSSKLQAAFQEEQALLRQEALIREEEEASRVADERSQRKAEADKERRAKKKACFCALGCFLGMLRMFCMPFVSIEIQQCAISMP
jgi:hypothetical protein